jgi:hypothetical protein
VFEHVGHLQRQFVLSIRILIGIAVIEDHEPDR